MGRFKYLVLILSIFSKCFSRIYPTDRYDKSITLFSPDGELLQVNYANVASKNGAPIICIKAENNAIIMCCISLLETRALLEKRAIEKVSLIDDSIWMGFSGLSGDGRALTRKARLFCNNFRLTFGYPPTISAVAREIGKVHHMATLKGGKHFLSMKESITESLSRRTPLRSSHYSVGV